MQVIATAWNDYRQRVMPRNAHPVQVQECRRAFYGGVVSVLDSLMKVFGPGTEPTESDLVIMAGVKAEIDQFYMDVRNGKA